jgi:hypothetical protein
MLVEQKHVAPDLFACWTLEAFTNLPEAGILFHVLDFQSARSWHRFWPVADN